MVLRNFDIRGTAVHLCSESRARSYWKASTNWRKYRTNLGFRLYWKTDEKTGSRSWNWKFFIKGCCCPRGTRTNWLAPWKSRFLAGKKNVYHWKSHFEPFDDFRRSWCQINLILPLKPLASLEVVGWPRQNLYQSVNPFLYWIPCNFNQFFRWVLILIQTCYSLNVFGSLRKARKRSKINQITIFPKMKWTKKRRTVAQRLLIWQHAGCILHRNELLELTTCILPEQSLY